MLLRAPRAGTLPEADHARVGSVSLPGGLLVSPDESFASSSTPGPVVWITREPVAEVGALWRDIAFEFSQHGLWPLVLESLHDADDRPWLVGELDPALSSSPGEHDPRSVLEEEWASVVPSEEEEPDAFARLAPFGREFPGLARMSEEPADEGALQTVTAGMNGRLGLVAVTRPADALAVLGWLGPLNHYGDMGKLGSVLRSWEDRFGAYLVGVGFATMTLAVQSPPHTLEFAFQIAAEHFAMCSDNIYQGAGSIDEYASALVDQSSWIFWWD
jgi:hypothetical protein